MIGVHAQAHRAAGQSPFEAGIGEDLGQPLFLGLQSHKARARNDHATHAVDASFRPFSTSAAARRSSIRPLVQEPMNTASMPISEAVFRAAAPCSPATAARRRPCRRRSSSGAGTVAVIGSTSSGEVPQVTTGAMSSPFRVTTLSQ
jgi:hypothetical protein